ncbi:hypothetical protein BLNAU_8969 [Blattamonas nauphoetae]|uniref:Uncharacterized protein n=1 Tax=Blattamonas nauphoetae TaxID=2049346 RepID=A0ABQ9XWZ6_9EUKA|nr:hypothetical protein BLNAU_8969 [Blattamonas nauphoetae]
MISTVENVLTSSDSPILLNEFTLKCNLQPEDLQTLQEAGKITIFSVNSSGMKVQFVMHQNWMNVHYSAEPIPEFLESSTKPPIRPEFGKKTSISRTPLTPKRTLASSNTPPTQRTLAGDLTPQRTIGLRKSLPFKSPRKISDSPLPLTQSTGPSQPPQSTPAVLSVSTTPMKGPLHPVSTIKPSIQCDPLLRQLNLLQPHDVSKNDDLVMLRAKLKPFTFPLYPSFTLDPHNKDAEKFHCSVDAFLLEKEKAANGSQPSEEDAKIKELQVLCTKWKGVCIDVTQELYAKTKDSLKSMLESEWSPISDREGWSSWNQMERTNDEEHDLDDPDDVEQPIQKQKRQASVGLFLDMMRIPRDLLGYQNDSDDFV